MNEAALPLSSGLQRNWGLSVAYLCVNGTQVLERGGLVDQPAGSVRSLGAGLYPDIRHLNICRKTVAPLPHRSGQIN